MKMKKVIWSLIAFLAFAPADASESFYAGNGLKIACGLGAGALYALNSFRKVEGFEPTLENIGATTVTPISESSTEVTIYDYMDSLGRGRSQQSQEVIISTTKKCKVRAERGIHLDQRGSKEPVIVFSSSFLPKVVKDPKKILPSLSYGWPGQPGRAFYAAGCYLGTKAIPTTCVTFDYRDTRASLNIAQKLDQQCLSLVTDEIVQQDRSFILFGGCRGATNILTFLTERPKEYLEANVRAAILESVPLSLKDICAQTARISPGLNWLPHYAGSAALYALFRFVLPNHKYQESTILDRVNNIPQGLPILITQVKKDEVVADERTKLLLQKLVETGHRNVHFLLLDNRHLDHYTLSTAPAYSPAVNAFLAHHGLPHNAELAAAGYRMVPSVLQPLVCPVDTTAPDYIQNLWEQCAINPDGSPAH